MRRKRNYGELPAEKRQLKLERRYAREAAAHERAAMRAAAKRAREMHKRMVKAARSNPPKPLKRLNKSTGWMKASSVKIRRNKGKYEVLIRRSKPRRKAATKRPARRKTTRRRR